MIRLIDKKKQNKQLSSTHLTRTAAAACGSRRRARARRARRTCRGACTCGSPRAGPIRGEYRGHVTGCRAPIGYLDHAVVERGEDPGPVGVEGQPLHPGRLGLELGQHLPGLTVIPTAYKLCFVCKIINHS